MLYATFKTQGQGKLQLRDLVQLSADPLYAFKHEITPLMLF